MSETKLLCAWCGTPLDDKGMKLWDDATGCETCYSGPELVIEITCNNKDCPKYGQVIYRKEG